MTALVARGEEKDALRRVLRETRRAVWLRRWAFASLMAVLIFTAVSGFGLALAVTHAYVSRPVPKPEVHVVAVGNGFRTELGQAQNVDEMQGEAWLNVVYSDLARYISAREGYLWEKAQDDYNTVFFMSAEQERQSYVRLMQDKTARANPMRVFGEGPNALKARVTDYAIQWDRNAPDATPYAATAHVVVAYTQPGVGTVCVLRKVIRVTWQDVRAALSAKFKREHVPSGIFVGDYQSGPVPGEPVPAPCNRFVVS